MTQPGSKESNYSCLLSFKSFHLPFFISYYGYMLMHFRTIRWSIDVGWASTWVKIVNEWFAATIYCKQIHVDEILLNFFFSFLFSSFFFFFF
jgi:hypothetical protein